MGKQNVSINEIPMRSRGTSFAMVGVVLLLGAFYLYATNKVAVQGFGIREAEKRVAQLGQENNQLRIREAELKSLYRIEETGKRLNMFEPAEVSYIEENGPLALR